MVIKKLRNSPPKATQSPIYNKNFTAIILLLTGFPGFERQP